MPGILDDCLNSTSSENNNDTANTSGLNGQQILEENSNFQPTAEEILEYAEQVLELQAHETEELMWIAEQGIKAALPEGWKPVTTEDNDLYYFNFNTGESMWEHPCDSYYKELAGKERKKLADNNRKKLQAAKSSSGSNEVPKRSSSADRKREKEAKSGQTSASSLKGGKLKPLQMKSGRAKLDSDEERDFIRSLRSSTEVEEKVIEPPVERKPLRVGRR